ncbi:uncharacterized protein BCR38DRAFT_522459 [Pseudomassariella vexata]|uniref:Uncharacterized protein n=1 Tax=Pseudomassariella vexata TaxID=1141098 RepID=A0A1Y2E7N4_9PEZI|nr:uncharacterized protein BCR38DRAFT_522459 [Pseudomassariella vexata]ORY67550.1 hypothetical protein BCR38DRAFT_522459 [Pseudomassariella vexata]
MSTKTDTPKELKAPKATGVLTEREMQVLGIAWQCFTSPPEIDVPKLAALAGFGNPRSATNCLANAKKKIMALGNASVAGNTDDGDINGPGPSTPAKAKTPRKRAPPGSAAKSTTGKRKRIASTPAEESPTKKPKAAAAVAEEAYDEEIKDDGIKEADVKEKITSECDNDAEA